MSNKCIIMDLDGTLADLDHRLHYIKEGRDWDSFFDTVDQDSPIWEIIDLCNILYKKYPVFICSGRSDICKEKTLQWLEKYDVKYDRIFMRKEGDYRPDTKVKQDMINEIRKLQYEPYIAVDDRQRIARVWRDNGIKTLQCDDWEEREPTVAKDNPILTIMVGPSGAGKSTYIEQNLPDTYCVSSDDMRFYLTGNYKDQTKNDQVFAACHGVTRSLLLQGIDVVFDATNIKNKDRKAVVNCAPDNTVVKYIVVDRPYEVKLRDCGWRPEWLIKKHHETFKSNIKDIMAGDNLNITVEDHRVS